MNKKNLNDNISMQTFKDIQYFTLFMIVVTLLSISTVKGEIGFIVSNSYILTVGLMLFIITKLFNTFCSLAKVMIIYQLFLFSFLLLHVLLSVEFLAYSLIGDISLILYVFFVVFILLSIKVISNSNKKLYFKSLKINKILNKSLYSFHSFHPMSKNSISLYKMISKFYFFVLYIISVLGGVITLYLYSKSGINYSDWNSQKVLVSILIICPIYIFLGASYKGTLFSICDLIAVLEQEKIIGHPILVKPFKKGSIDN